RTVSRTLTSAAPRLKYSASITVGFSARRAESQLPTAKAQAARRTTAGDEAGSLASASCMIVIAAFPAPTAQNAFASCRVREGGGGGSDLRERLGRPLVLCRR